MGWGRGSKGACVSEQQRDGWQRQTFKGRTTSMRPAMVPRRTVVTAAGCANPVSVGPSVLPRMLASEDASGWNSSA
jgi:hypothetical protein